MKWFKHYTDSLDDPFIFELITRFSGNGYMVYFGIIEMICRENKKELTGKAEFSMSYLRRKFSLKSKTIQNVISFCQECNKFVASFHGDKVVFSFPKILEIKDNYTKDLQVTCKKLSLEKEKEKETTLSKPPASPDVKLAIDFYHDEFEKVFGATPMIDGAKDGKLMKSIVSKYGLEKTKNLITAFLKSDDSWIENTGRTIGVFKTQINKLIIPEKPKVRIPAL